MNRLKKLKITYYFIIIAIVCLGFYFLQKIGSDSSEDILSVFGEDIYFTYTDDNTGEDLIIKSDKKDYEGFNESTVYFNLTNTKRRTELIDLQVLFNNGSGSVTNIDKWDKQKRDWVSLDEEKFVLSEGTVPDPESGIRSFFARLFRQGQSLLARLKGTVPVPTVLDSLTLKTRTQYLIESKETAYFRMAINYPPMSQGEFFIQAQGNKGGYGLLDPWYSSSWSYRKKITIDNSQVTTDAVDFPVLATTTDSDLASKARSDAYDVVFTDSTGTILNYEREKWTSATGELVTWIQTDISSTTDTILYMYYGNADQASDLATTTGVWDDNYVMVQHLQETDIDGDAGDIKDSTKYVNDGTTNNMDTDDDVAAQIDGGFDFDGSDDYVDAGTTLSLNVADSITIVIWMKSDNRDQLWSRLISKLDDTTGWNFQKPLTSSGVLRTRIDTSAESNQEKNIADDVYDNDWHMIVLILDNGDWKSYVDFSETHSGTYNHGDGFGSTANLNIGRDSDSASNYFDGTTDEVRISNIARSAQWIETEYNSQSAVGEFITFGAEQTDNWYNSDWHFRKKITINNSQVTTNAADFPVLATTTDTDLRDKAMDAGQDILFTSSDGLTKIPHEIEKFEKTSGELVAWVKTDLASTTDTTLYMYYGNYQSTHQASSTLVWDDNYKGVWHLAHDGVATTTYPDFLDSTSNDNDGSSKNMVGDISNLISTSTIDGGVGFDGTDDEIDLGTKASLYSMPGKMTVSAWVYPSSATQLDDADIFYTANNYVMFNVDTGTTMRFMVQTDSGYPQSSTTYTKEVWTHFVGTYNGSETRIYKNGVLADFDSAAGTLLVGSGTSYIGGGGNDSWNGTIDEVRVANTARSAQWIETEYNSQGAVGEFMTKSGEEKYSLYPETEKDWYNTDWKYRKKISIDADKVAADLTDFPVLLNYKDSRLINQARDDGYDIVFTNSTSITTLQFEREKFATSTGELVYWVKTDVSSTTDTILYMYYGNPNQATDLATTTGVWDDNFKLVQHMHHDWDATAEDSTKYDNDGTNTNFYSATSSVSTSQIDGGIDFDDIDDYVNIAHSSTLNVADGTNPFSLTSWIYAEDPTSSNVIIEKHDSWQLRLENSLYLYESSDWSSLCSTGAGVVTANSWTHVSLVFDTTCKIYVNAIDVTSDSTIDPLTTTVDPAHIGAEMATGPPGHLFNGTIDEVRISNTARSAQWIETEYNNQVSPTTFARFDVEEQYNRTTQINTSLVNTGPQSGLVGHWTFNGKDMDWSSSTAEALDRSGNSNNGNVVTNFGQEDVAIGISGQALEFDGSDDYVNCGSNSSLDDLGPMTISAWVYPESQGEAYTGIIATKNTDADTSSGNWRFSFHGEDSRTLVFEKGYDETVLLRYSGWYVYTINTWQLVAMTWDGSSTASNIKFYSNGVEMNGFTQDGVGNKLSDAAQDLFIGSDYWTMRAFDGFIDEVRIYNRVLSADEIENLYQAGARRLQPDAPLTQFQTGGLVGSWTFNGPDMDWGANTATDRSGEGNDGTITNMSTSTSPAIGISGQALDFDGSDDYVEGGTSSLNWGTSDYSVSAWIKTTQTSQAIIVGKRTGGVDGWLFFHYDSNTLTLRLDVSDVMGDYDSSDVTLNDDIWHHVAFSADRDGNAYFYVDGIPRGSPDISSKSGNMSNTKPFGIGANNLDTTPINHFDGLIDEVRVYNRALSADEITDLYQAGARRFRTN